MASPYKTSRAGAPPYRAVELRLLPTRQVEPTAYNCIETRQSQQAQRSGLRGCVEFSDWLASLTGKFSLDASLYAGQPNCRMSTNQLYLGFMVVVLGVYKIPQGNSHYILYVGSLIVLKSMLNQASVLLSANQPCIAQTALYSDICSCKL